MIMQEQQNGSSGLDFLAFITIAAILAAASWYLVGHNRTSAHPNAHVAEDASALNAEK